MKVAWMIFGIIIGASLYPIVVEAQDYFGKFPPTPAWQELEIDNNATTINPLQNQTFINATSYKDKLWIVTDGSIIASFVDYP